MSTDLSEPTHAILNAFLEFRKSGFRQHAPGQLGRSEASILMALDHHPDATDGGMRVSDLAKALRSSPPTMTQSTASLFRMGYVERQHDPHDRRVVRIVLTKAGREAIEAHKKGFYESCERLAQALGRDDSLKFAELMLKAAQFMHKEPRP